MLNGGMWEDIYVPVRITKNGKVIFQIETKTIRETKIIDKL